MNQQKKIQKVGILQLSRIGDILMSLPVIERVSKKYEPAEICFFINGMFEGLLPCSPYFKLVPLHFNELFEDLKETHTHKEAFQLIDTYIGEYLSTSFDLVLNLSSQKLSAILTSLLDARERRGLTFSKDESLTNPDAYLSLFTETKTGRMFNWLHQVDIYSSAVDGFKPTPIHITGEYLFGNSFQAFIGDRRVDQKYILISPGASIPQKEIDKGILQTVVQALLDRTPYHIVLCGIQSDEACNKELHVIDPVRMSDYTAKTDLAGLYNLIYYSDCLICNDSGPMHMAALLDKKNIVFSSGSAFFPETTGYNNHIMVFTPQHGCYPCPWTRFKCDKSFACRGKFPRDRVIRWVLDYLCDRERISPDALESVYVTSIDEYGLQFVPYGQNTLPIAQFLGLLYQCFWKEKLHGLDAMKTLKHAIEGYRADPAHLVPSLEALTDSLRKIADFLDDILSLFSEFRRHRRSEVLDRINRGIDKIFELSDKDTFLSPLLQYYRVLYHSIVTQDFGKLLAVYHKNTVALREDVDRIGNLITFFQFDYG